MDTLDKMTGSLIMAAVRSRGNRSTEVEVTLLPRKYGLKGWRRHYLLVLTR